MNYGTILHNRSNLLQSEHNCMHYMDILITDTKTITKMIDTCTYQKMEI